MKEELKRRGKDLYKDIAEDRLSEYKLDFEDYRTLLKREVSRESYKIIDNLIDEKKFDRAVNYVEESIGDKLELPLKNIVVSEGILEGRGVISEDRLILNERLRNRTMLKTLKEELSTCKEFIFIVSFIRFSGLQLLISKLKELEEQGIKGRILTSVYMNITEPKALKKLMDFKNIEVKIYNANRDSFHTKSYIFKRKNNQDTIIVGSSNISQQALLFGEEWNLKVKRDSGDIHESAMNHFNKLWNSEESLSLTDELLERYKSYRDSKDRSRDYTFDFLEERKENKRISPNSMQEEILANLKNLRRKNKKRAVVIAATGTGKTYLSAFDIKNCGYKRILFIAHREELLKGAHRTYTTLFNKDRMGFFTGNEKSYKSDILFATIQTLSKDEYLYRFKEDEFDYIVVDEFHHSAANSYNRVISYFKPNFLLGLTATPERMDGRDILEICDYNIAGEIRLKEALERELLVPFHYFGIQDSSVDYSSIPERNGRFVEEKLSKELSQNKRIKFIVEGIEDYLYDGDRMRALGFCVDKNHARFMANEFNLKGIKSEVIIADTPRSARERILEELRMGRIQVIFTVDIFNEGIDIPELNLILMLRPTESSTIFIQQLGRGLRKHKEKDFVTILDFIGNYRKNFIGAKTLIREFDGGRREVRDSGLEDMLTLPYGSNIEFDRVCQRRILDKLGKIRYTSKTYARDIYMEVKNRLGRPLNPTDFINEEDSYRIVVRSFNSFKEARIACGDEENLKDDIYQSNVLMRLDRMYPLKRPHEIMILKMLLELGSDGVSLEEVIAYLGLDRSLPQQKRVIRAFKELAEEDKNSISFGRIEGDNFHFNGRFIEALRDDNFNREFFERIKLLIKTYEKDFKVLDGNLEIHKKYSRLDLQILLDSDVPKGSWRAGYAKAGNEICLFITMEKDKSLDEHLKYDNYFDNQNVVQWISQSKTSHNSKIGKMFVEHEKQGIKIHIFIRREREIQGETQDFIYLGEAKYSESHGDKPMYLKWQLNDKVPDKIFLDLTR